MLALRSNRPVAVGRDRGGRGLERLLGIGGKRLLSQAVGERPDLRGANRPLDAGVEIEGWDHGCLRGVVCCVFTICSSQQKSPEGDFGGGE